eukprot:SAG31_NODE_75_length_27561_cov_28.859333_13_plen_69_part_00
MLKLMLRDAADISRQFLAEVSHLSASKAARVATDRLLVLARSAVPGSFTAAAVCSAPPLHHVNHESCF